MEEGNTATAEGRSQNTVILHANDGWYYNVREVRASRVRLRCRYLRRGCRGTAAINRETLHLYHLQPHNHEPDPLLLLDLELRRNMVADASTNLWGRTIRQILIDWRARCGNADLASRFTTARMRSGLYEARSANYPTIPRTLLYLGILLGLPNMRAVCTTVDRLDLIFRGTIGNIQNRTVAVVFISGRMLQLMQEVLSIHCDGTFKKRPRKPKTSQIFNIVTTYGRTVIALMRVLMTSRTEAAYLALCRYIRLLAPDTRPAAIHCDFERAQMNALSIVFHEATIVGCLWHYAVAVSRYARSLGLGELIRHNPLVRSFVRCLCAVPLLPRDRILDGVMEIWAQVEASGWADTLRPLFQYFEREWLPRLNELSVFGFPERTNNSSESDNRSMANVLQHNHPNIWQLVAAFVQLEYIAWSDKLAVDAGRVVNGPRKASAVINDASVQRFSLLLSNGSISPGHFLHLSSWSILAAFDHGLQLDNQGSDSEESDSDSD